MRFLLNQERFYMKKSVLVSALAVYVISSVGSYTAFSYFASDSTSLTLNVGSEVVQEEENELTALTALLEISPDEPRDQECPLSGRLYTQQEQQAWSKHRPLAVMIENHPESRPQSGLNSADIVFEALAEGGVTRFMGMFYCDAQAYDITLAPIRSARTYFIDWASGFNWPLYVHVGGANLPGPADALGQIGQYGWALENDLNQFSIGYPTFVRNFNRLDGKEIATEHTMETSTKRLWDVGEARGWTNISPERKSGRITIGGDDWLEGYTPWKFADSEERGDVASIAYSFWSGYGDYSVEWNYDAQQNSYLRKMAGVPHVDLNTDKQISAENVVILFTTEKGPIDELKHMLYTTTGKGKALVFNNGEVVSANWAKKERESQLTFTDTKGAEIEFSRGKVWISVLDNDVEVVY